MIDNTLTDSSTGQARAIDESAAADSETNTAGQIVFTLAIIIALALAIYVARGWKSETALFPLTVGYPMLALSIASLGLSLVKSSRIKQSLTPSLKGLGIDLRNGPLAHFGWLAGFALAIWALSFPVAAVVYVFLYMKLQGRLSWRTSILYSIGCLIFITVVFGMAFEVVWPTGVLLKALGT